jgi:hypothetical protein
MKGKMGETGQQANRAVNLLAAIHPRRIWPQKIANFPIQHRSKFPQKH